jgi:hypothetical protein
MTKKKPPDQLQKSGRKSTFLKPYVDIARRMAYLGATDQDLAIAFGVSIMTIIRWRAQHEAFRDAIGVGKGEANKRVERSLYQKAVGYSYDSVKIFMPAGAKVPCFTGTSKYPFIWCRNVKLEEQMNESPLLPSANRRGPHALLGLDTRRSVSSGSTRA